MTSFAWIIILVSLLTLAGSLALLFVTVKYYWGARGRPPARGAERRRQKEEELQLRSRQIEHSRQHPRETRKPDFFDNTKPRPRAESKFVDIQH